MVSYIWAQLPIHQTASQPRFKLRTDSRAATLAMRTLKLGCETARQQGAVSLNTRIIGLELVYWAWHLNPPNRRQRGLTDDQRDDRLICRYISLCRLISMYFMSLTTRYIEVPRYLLICSIYRPAFHNNASTIPIQKHNPAPQPPTKPQTNQPSITVYSKYHRKHSFSFSQRDTNHSVSDHRRRLKTLTLLTPSQNCLENLERAENLGLAKRKLNTRGRTPTHENHPGTERTSRIKGEKTCRVQPSPMDIGYHRSWICAMDVISMD